MARWPLHPLSSTQAQVLLIPTAFGVDTQAPTAILAAGSQISAFEPLLGVDVDELAVGQCTPLHDEPPYGMCEAIVQQGLLRQQWPVLLPSAMPATLGAIRAVWKRYGPISIVYCSAHATFKSPVEYMDTEGDPTYSHFNWVERLHQLHFPVIHVGVRSSSKRAWEALQAQDQPIFGSHQRWDPEDVVASLPEHPIFVVIDCNVLDPTLVPTVLHPEPGGIPWPLLQQTIQAIFSHRTVVGVSLGGLIVGEGTKQAARHIARLLNWVLACHQSNTLSL